MAQLTPFLLQSVCVRARRQEGRGPVLISRLQLHLSPAHLIMTTRDKERRLFPVSLPHW